MSISPSIYDVVVIGSGVAGLSVALSLTGYRVLLITKTQLGAGSSQWAQGGIAAAMGEGDSPALHARDTLAVSGDIANANAVSILTQLGPDCMRRLMDVGVQFDREQGELCLGREAAHSRPRILHAQGDATGAELVRALTLAVRQTSGIEVAEAWEVVELVVNAGRVVGVLARQGAEHRLYRAPAAVLATGGIGQLYRYTTNPPEATADGLALAARAGARLADIEFVQFHPTALAVDRDPRPLLTEALRGAGAILVNELGERFMLNEHEAAELAPRDVVARAIWGQLQAGHTVFLDAREAIGARFPKHFPTVFAICQKQGLDPRAERLPVVPAAHYHMGGVAVDLLGRTDVVGLWACGEVACTGVHGANRLASNSLLEGLVFAERVSQDLREFIQSRGTSVSYGLHLSGVSQRLLSAGEEDVVVSQIRNIMWTHVGLVRTASGLVEALGQLRELEDKVKTRKGKNMLTVAQLIATAALAREESRGAHFRIDYPAPTKVWAHGSVWTLKALAPKQAARVCGN
ncbi:L-aspartate oxidase [Candidatus Entotheonella serta]|nr:L-aspartate oxidase [Candidatus Entotheonella serta]